MKRNKDPKELSPRQIILVNYLEGKGWTKQAEIIKDLIQYYAVDSTDYENFGHDSSNRIRLTNDIKEINLCNNHTNVIISSSIGIKLASVEEATRFADNMHSNGLEKLHLARRIKDKVDRSNKIDINGNTYELNS